MNNSTPETLSWLFGPVINSPVAVSVTLRSKTNSLYPSSTEVSPIGIAKAALNAPSPPDEELELLLDEEELELLLDEEELELPEEEDELDDEVVGSGPCGPPGSTGEGSEPPLLHPCKAIAPMATSIST